MTENHNKKIMKKNILVFPCGSEIALEIYRSLKYSRHFNMIGASSTDDHGKFIFKYYIGSLPFIWDENFLPYMKTIVKNYKIDAIYPSMDSVITVLKKNENYLDCKIISSIADTCEICSSKTKTYSLLNNIIPTPTIYSLTEVTDYPVFGKPDIGYGSRWTKKILNRGDLNNYISEYPNSIICELLTGEEYTVDCFTDKDGVLRYWSPRERKRIMNGISVNTISVDKTNEFLIFAEKINKTIKFRGAWFFQVKRDRNGILRLLEVASRIGGSSALHRSKGINLVLLTLFDAFDYKIEITENNYHVELDRALDNKYYINISYDEVFIDLDDCIIIDNNINLKMITFLYQCINNNIKISMLTRHEGDVNILLREFKIDSLFDRVIHINAKSPKSEFIDNYNAIFIDDSFSERDEIRTSLSLNVFSPDMIECLIND